MIVRRNLSLRRISSHIGRPLMAAGGVSVVAVVLRRWLGEDVVVPFVPVGTLGAAVAIFVAFRNNASYGRWWEGRTVWANLHNAARVFARQILAATQVSPPDNDGAVDTRRAAEIVAFRREQVLRVIALGHSSRIHLRGSGIDPGGGVGTQRGEAWSALRPFLPAEEFDQLMARDNKPNILLQTLAIRVKDGVRAGILGQFDPISLEPTMATMSAAITACERLKDTPTPRQYDYFTRVSVAMFALLLPFALLGLIPAGRDWLVIALSVVIVGVFVVLEVVGSIVEAPFENRTTDVPMTYISIEIERDLLEQLGDEHRPPRLTHEGGYLW